MAEFCEYCGNMMERWDATHCSEECILASIKNSRSLHDNNEFDALLREMGQKKCYDINLLKDLK